MSVQAILGSFKLWIEFQRTNEHQHLGREEAIVEINLANQESIDDVTNEDEDDEEEDGENNENEGDTSQSESRIVLSDDLEEEEASGSQQITEAEREIVLHINEETIIVTP
jgi:hypothetical protein